MGVPLKYEPFEANIVPVGAPPAHDVVVDDEHATGKAAELKVNPVDATAQVVAVAIEAQFVKI